LKPRQQPNPQAKRIHRQHKIFGGSDGEVYRRAATLRIYPAHRAGFFVY
jgi:hypothetical protein